MRCGFQTVIWGRQIDDLDLVLDQIVACGYEGVEIAQSPRDILVSGKLVNRGDPTKFTIVLPESLQHVPPARLLAAR